MRSQLRRAIAVAFIGVIAALLAPAAISADTARASDRRDQPHVTAIAAPAVAAPSLAPRLRAFDFGFIGIFVLTAFSLVFASRARQRITPRRLPRIRALGYGRRGPPLASV